MSEYNVNPRYAYLSIFPMKSFEYIKPLDMQMKWSDVCLYFLCINLPPHVF